MRIVLFFTRGMSLAAWDAIGNLEREIAIYRWLVNSGVTVDFITYGGLDDYNYKDRVQGINIHYNRFRLTPRWYERLIPVLHWKVLSRASIIKTNQTDGGEVALNAARFWNKPFVARCGYMLSTTAVRDPRREQQRIEFAYELEKLVFSNADRIFVTTTEMANDVKERLPLKAASVRVIPNYVDTDVFFPKSVRFYRYDICYIGRLSLEKNIHALLAVAQQTSLRLLIIGDGPLRTSIQSAIQSLDERLTWLPKVPNGDLPFYINSSRIFVLPSLYEGHPKSLIEAMSCGACVVGTNVPGIREIINHGETGWLCDTDADSLKSAIERLVHNSDLQRHLGTAARKFVLSNYALDLIAVKEFNELAQVCNLDQRR